MIAHHCGPVGLTSELAARPGDELEPRSGRHYFLDIPSDYRPGEQVTFLLQLHGAGSSGNWTRHYFPAVDFKDRHRLVIAAPTASTEQPIRMWTPADDSHLEDIVRSVTDRFGAGNIASFWLVGHSQGGYTSNRIVTNPFFRDRVDGWLSLSGGRIGDAPIVPGFGPRPGAAIPQAPGAPPLKLGGTLPIDCDISFIFATGEHEITHLPETSPWADRYGGGVRVRQAGVADERGGWVYDTRQTSFASPAWGREPRGGTAQVFVYPGCRDGRLVADVMRMDKGHTEGLEPNVTEALIRMMLSAPGGKLQGR
ncbi:MAG TPA: hypothetical protein VHX64_18050 [Caulobacteraceae bacterium]|nr:hypothetical protein [Caulobacteraceae bacterium]